MDGKTHSMRKKSYYKMKQIIIEAKANSELEEQNKQFEREFSKRVHDIIIEDETLRKLCKSAQATVKIKDNE